MQSIEHDHNKEYKNKKHKNLNHVKPNHLIPTLVLIAVIVALSLVTTIGVERIVNEECLSTLRESVSQGAAGTRLILENAEQEMRLVSDMLADHTTLNETTAARYIDSLDKGSIISSFSVLLPGDIMVYPSQNAVVLDSTPSFAAESLNDVRFISVYDNISSEKYAVYTAPIVDGDVTEGVLYGYIRLADLPEYFELSAFDSRCQIYLVDGTTGDFIMDTWHDTLGNINDEALSSRKTKKGTSLDSMQKAVSEGYSEYVVFESKTTGEDFYMYTEPLGLYNLSFQVTVPEKVAFAEAIRIRRLVGILAFLQFISIIAYVALFLKRQLKANRKNRQRMELKNAVSEMQQTLFGVYENPYLAEVSLEQFQNAARAEKVALLLLSKGVIERFLCLPAVSEAEQASYIGKKFSENMFVDFKWKRDMPSIKLDENDKKQLEIAATLPGLNDIELRNFVGARTWSSEGSMVGILYAVNTEDPSVGKRAVEMAANSFYLAIRAMDSYNRLYRVGNFDSMTGLKNRNAYQNDLRKYSDGVTEVMCCIYVDANGLHDINNLFGHATGDKMLKAIGVLIRELFGFENSYRIGGDEFVIICHESDEKVIMAKLDSLKMRLNQNSYYISIGYAFCGTECTFSHALEAAESKMYSDKKAFYAAHPGSRHRSSRQRNKQVETVLMSDAEQDRFISAISEDFLGVYLVNISTDITRAIYKPSYFAELLRQTKYRFHAALAKYSDLFVAADDRAEFNKFMNYEDIHRRLKSEQIITYTYHKSDGVAVRLRILSTSSYSDKKRSTLWIFEKCD